MAFDIITKNQISNLESPSIKCVDMVSTELLTIIKGVADSVSHCVVCVFCNVEVYLYVYVAVDV